MGRFVNYVKFQSVKFGKIFVYYRGFYNIVITLM